MQGCHSQAINKLLNCRTITNWWNNLYQACCFKKVVTRCQQVRNNVSTNLEQAVRTHPICALTSCWGSVTGCAFLRVYNWILLVQHDCHTQVRHLNFCSVVEILQGFFLSSSPYMQRVLKVLGLCGPTYTESSWCWVPMALRTRGPHMFLSKKVLMVLDPKSPWSWVLFFQYARFFLQIRAFAVSNTDICP